MHRCHRWHIESANLGTRADEAGAAFLVTYAEVIENRPIFFARGCIDVFFYEPVYSFYVADAEELVELVIFAILAVVIAYLVTVLRDLRRMGPDQLR